METGNMSLGEKVQLLLDRSDIEMMRGKDNRGGGLDTNFRVWAHLEHLVKVDVNGDEALSVALHIHNHETKDSKGSTAAVG